MDLTNTTSKLLSVALLACALGCRSADTTVPVPGEPGEPGERAPADPGAPSAEESTPQPGAAPGLRRPDEIVLVRVDGEELTLTHAMKRFEGSHGGHSVLVRGEPAIRDLIGRLVEHQVLLAEAKSLGVAEEEEVVGYLGERRQLLAEGLFWKHEVDERVEIDEADVEAYYAKTEMALAITLIETAERAACEELRQRVEAGEGMAELAVDGSIHPSRSSGGLLPFVRRGDLAPALDGAIFALAEEGELTEVVATEGGFAFARLDTRTLNENRPERELMLPQIRQVLLEERRKERRAEVELRVREEAGVQIDDEQSKAEHVLDTSRDPGTVVARAAGEDLTLGELQDYLDLDRLRAAPTERAQEAVDSIVREWTDRKAVRKAAGELGLFDHADIDAEIDAYREDVLMAYLLGEYIYAGIEVGVDDARAYYEEHVEDAFTFPPRARIAYLVVATREEAQEVLGRLEAGESFADLARELSLDATASAHGGRIGWVSRGDLLEEIEEPVLSAEPDSVLGPLETPSGWFVVHVIESRPAAPMPFETVLPRSRRLVEAELRSQAYSLWVNRLRERADVVVDEDGIQEAVAWLEVEAQRLEEEKAREAPTGSPHGETGQLGPPAGAVEVEPAAGAIRAPGVVEDRRK